MLKSYISEARTEFRMYSENNLEFFNDENSYGEQIIDFQLDKLEPEYDYDTDEE